MRRFSSNYFDLLLALAYTNIQIVAKCFSALTALKSPNCSVSRVTAASVAAAGLTISRCYAHRAHRLTLMKPMCIDSRHVCAEATEDNTLVVTFAAARIYSSPCRPLLPRPRLKISHRFCTNYISGPWESGGSSCSICHCVQHIPRPSTSSLH